jgi:hypothetical protein
MRHYKLVVYTKPVAGRDQEYNDWYENTHLSDLVAIPGINSAQRFRLAKSLSPETSLPFLAIYDNETDDIDGVIAEMKRLSGTEAMTISDALDKNASAMVFEEFGSFVAARKPNDRSHELLKHS